MQTYSHILITAVISLPLKQLVDSRSLVLPQVRIKALLLGSLLPDLALILIAVVCLTRDWLLGVFSSNEWVNHDMLVKASDELLNLSWTASLFDDWFFNNPIVITLQNTFHSPFILVLLIGIVYWYWNKTRYIPSDKKLNNAFSYLFWVFCAALLHTLIDIPLHTTDGPLIFFPIDWSYRYASPISYWDPMHHGRAWSLFEHSLDVVLAIYLLWFWYKAKK